MQLNADQVAAALPWETLIPALQDIFTREVCAPVRHHHSLNVPQEPEATLLLMPAWLEGEYLGIKQVNVFPGNNARNMPGLSSHYLLSCGKTGQHLVQLEGNELTARRTAAASALASQLLSAGTASQMLMVGAGRMARRLIPAHMSVRPIKTVYVWDRNPQACEALVTELQAQDIDARICAGDQLETLAAQADIISCATMANEPVIRGDWLKPGAHLDLVGSFTPTMRETDNAALQRGAVFVDTRAGALSETGDLIIPIAEGAFSADDIEAEFSELCSGAHAGRSGLPDAADAITVFKSVGDSREDLAAAILAYQHSTD
ncbi:bifunctional Delta(1)-pyrroline-2-carboxylate/Delta(1)-piperideine-2-carboxylate reductase [Marinobacterium jannaschii]|uniref:ornithine cyclodeaminase family protein n=1 Tax=Marinobacterium jannaschii TaxID=64970 RepID=UPI0004812186|nr:ornithine cyclodeaminase family protein [Marinobacterium jannaschii]